MRWLGQGHKTEVLGTVEVGVWGSNGIPGQVVGLGCQITAFIAIGTDFYTRFQRKFRCEQPHKGYRDLIEDLPAVLGFGAVEIEKAFMVFQLQAHRMITACAPA